MSQGKIVPLIAASAEKERVRTDALNLRIKPLVAVVPLIIASVEKERARTNALNLRFDQLVADVSEMARRLDEISEQLHAFIGNLRKNRENR